MNGKKYAACWVLTHVLAMCFLLVALIILNSGCSKKQTKIEIAPEPIHKSLPNPVVLEPSGRNLKPSGRSVKPLVPDSVVVYFDFDSDMLRPEETVKLAPFIEHPGVSLIIEGHTCTIGSSEYNIGLGLARASAVQRFIGRGLVVSWGEEKCMAVCGAVDESDCEACRKVVVRVK